MMGADSLPVELLTEIIVFAGKTRAPEISRKWYAAWLNAWESGKKIANMRFRNKDVWKFPVARCYCDNYSLEWIKFPSHVRELYLRNYLEYFELISQFVNLTKIIIKSYPRDVNVINVGNLKNLQIIRTKKYQFYLPGKQHPETIFIRNLNDAVDFSILHKLHTTTSKILRHKFPSITAEIGHPNIIRIDFNGLPILRLLDIHIDWKQQPYTFEKFEIRPIGNASSLTTLRLHSAVIRANFTLPALRELVLTHCFVEDLSCLAQLCHLELYDCDTAVDVLQTIRMPSIDKLIISGCKTMNLRNRHINFLKIHMSDVITTNVTCDHMVLIQSSIECSPLQILVKKSYRSINGHGRMIPQFSDLITSIKFSVRLPYSLNLAPIRKLKLLKLVDCYTESSVDATTITQIDELFLDGDIPFIENAELKCKKITISYATNDSIRKFAKRAPHISVILCDNEISATAIYPIDKLSIKNSPKSGNASIDLVLRTKVEKLVLGDRKIYGTKNLREIAHLKIESFYNSGNFDFQSLERIGRLTVPTSLNSRFDKIAKFLRHVVIGDCPAEISGMIQQHKMNTYT